ncbi:hypothetical protein D3C84_666890 [compost metagenome]
MTTPTIMKGPQRNSLFDNGYASNAVINKASAVPITVEPSVRKNDFHRSARSIICPQESSVNCLGQMVTRFISTALFELNEVETTDSNGINAMTDIKMRTMVMVDTNIFSPRDSNISTKAPHPKLSSIID